jgi:hypothetical protein
VGDGWEALFRRNALPPRSGFFENRGSISSETLYSHIRLKLLRRSHDPDDSNMNLIRDVWNNGIIFGRYMSHRQEQGIRIKEGD